MLLSGCSTKFVYKNFDWLVYWYVDDFVELSNEQEEIVDEKLKQWLIWHKTHELPKYLEHLKQLSSDIQTRQINFDRIDYHQSRASEHWIRLKERVIPDLVEMAPLLTEKQVESMFKELDDINSEDAEEREEHLALSDEERKKKTIRRNKKNLERWLGKLNREQEQLIEDTYDDYHPNGELWSQYKVRYQAELRALFDNSDRSKDFMDKLQSMLMNPEVYRSEGLTQRNLENGIKNKELLVRLDSLSTVKQRKHLLEEIAEFAEDVQALMQ